MNLEALALVINIVIAGIAGVGAMRKATSSGAGGLFVLALASALNSVCYLAYDAPAFRAQDDFWAAVMYLSAVVAASAVLVLALQQSLRSTALQPHRLMLLAVMPILTQVLFWVPALRSRFFQFTTMPSIETVFTTGGWSIIQAAYIYGLVAAALILSIHVFFRARRSLLDPTFFTAIGCAVPVLVLSLDLAGWSPIQGVELLPFAFGITALGYLQALLRPGGAGAPVDRNAVVEGMDEGWMVLDLRHHILDMNATSEKMTGTTLREVRGKHISSLLGDSPGLEQAIDTSQEFEMKRSMRSEEGWRYLNIRISPLAEEGRKPYGRLAVWRDMTERKLREDSRQRARDEMFALINAISSAANNTLSLDDFLLESIYHIVSPFRSPIMCIFLIDDRIKPNQDPRLYLASYLGLPASAAENLSFVPTSSPLFDWVFKNRQPFLVDDATDDGRVPAAIRKASISCFLMVPLTIQEGGENRMLGCMCLARKEKPPFNQDEIVRLNAIAEHMSNLIDSDRRRRRDITTKERQKLMRDLHDSVSQKLYGVVTTTEAAQASLEAGRSVDPAQEFARIGENARQAVREMRLFLYQMQQVDIEKEGLISVLHHRISAVEGRSDIKARLLIGDQGISLSKDKELMLYYIAQEAMNNVLRHAHAKSVLVTLKQGRRNVTMEIQDDGCGFDLKKVDRSGLGLQNMRERTAQINGTLKVTSRPNQGTKIVVTVRKDPVMAAAKTGQGA